MRVVVALTGCSGMRYGVRLLEVLQTEKLLVISDNGRDILSHELGTTPEELEERATLSFDDSDLFSPIASGSHQFEAMVIVPCSLSTLAKISNGIADTLITRCASVCLKEGRELIVVPREAPVDTIMLKNQYELAKAGATILPASPGFYHRPEEIGDLIDFIVGKILDQLGIEHQLFDRWD